MILGHDYPVVTNAVTAQAREGTLFSLPHPLGIEVAEKIRDLVPCSEMVRFAKNGNDVTTLAARLARAHTGREVIATQGYHGSYIWMGTTSMNRGVPEAVGDLTISFEYNDIGSVERIFANNSSDVAAIITTPTNLEAPKDGFLEHLREIATREGALLVCDEILTGFRFGLGGAQEFFDVTPDLACFGKSMANGCPLSAITGRSDIMELLETDEVFFSGTYAGEALSLAAAKACLSVLDDEPVIEHLWEQGKKLQDGYNEIAAKRDLTNYTNCRGYPLRSAVFFRDSDGKSDTILKSLFVQECLKRGVLFSGTHLPNFSHTDTDIENTLAVYDEAMATVNDAIEATHPARYLDGEPIGATLRDRLDENG